MQSMTRSRSRSPDRARDRRHKSDRRSRNHRDDRDNERRRHRSRSRSADRERERRRDEDHRKRTRSRFVLAHTPPLPPAHLLPTHLSNWTARLPTQPSSCIQCTPPIAHCLLRSPSRRRDQPTAAPDTHPQRDQPQPTATEDPEQAKKRARLEKLKAWKEQQAAAAAAAATVSPAAEPVTVPAVDQLPPQSADDGVNGNAAPSAW